ncbi:putative twin arginine-targeting protein translocase, TatA/E family [Clostridium pasteurianum DSM 525 = ATCC 6013]|uniref:Sec-independent protein translocase protein TatA n=1 Tax=Clostridium pasteurianum DSM 525 = ATCC 6013 TaxID=1262449 RepID=A0A0H3IZ63_CLOPA|nr:twin-arginine translocase TatA/TatE family subunit [Clostridium pasteurianum]AJA46811.1 putative twin arginine-targeting protein translocase, TatA/E family [Clostridium pasteurianum DSM 525 = ATCC 6013]AJA50799.1 putative twin arginine-targeting protein translocase, TatA/E family [Clostridium pasteurianum DSM 525 = ATCC 6013]AOZ74205.1 preprotein translocase subunit TatA [Clostridium pasteurianum DSM 525 = ATCC 6013]AOZ78003.1 preprotein translocase subunit TatA [Clostridium pasteurianum]EL
MPRIGFPELIIILVIALVIFGPGKLPSVGKSIGESIKEFKKASSEIAKGSTAEVAATETKAEEEKKES